MEKRKKEINDKILALLTAEQKAGWKKMLGAEFKFDKNMPMGPGGPGGPGRGPGGGGGGGGDF